MPLRPFEESPSYEKTLTSFLRAFWQGVREAPAGFVAPLVGAWDVLRRVLIAHPLTPKH